MCYVGVSNEGHSSSIAIGLSNDCKWAVNEASLTPCCHAVVHFHMKVSRFSARFQDDCPERSGPWPVCHVGASKGGRSSSNGDFVCNEQDQDPARSSS